MIIRCLDPEGKREQFGQTNRRRLHVTLASLYTPFAIINRGKGVLRRRKIVSGLVSVNATDVITL